MKAISNQAVSFEKKEQGFHRYADRTEAGQGREAQLDTLTLHAIPLAAEGLV